VHCRPACLRDTEIGRDAAREITAAAKGWHNIIGPEARVESGWTLAGRSILVVEDNPLVCLDITSRLEAEGATVYGASQLEKALGLADRPDLSAGVLDFDLGNVDSSLVCWKLVSRRIPFVFYTGRIYTAFRQWPTTPVVLKPASSGLIKALAGLFRVDRR
jgi:CheY-like chemotaxis protein